MDSLISYLEELLNVRGHFSIDDELAVGNVDRLQKSIRKYSLRAAEPRYPKKDRNEDDWHHQAPSPTADLDEELVARHSSEVELLREFEGLWNPDTRGLVKNLRGRKRQAFHLDMFHQQIEPRLRERVSSFSIDDESNICFLSGGGVVFPKNFIEVIEVIENLNAREDALFFRGHNNASYRLIPSIYRGVAAFYEKELLYDTINLLPEEVREASSNFEVLTKLQHFGTPTRLLDLSTNPLVGLYFACTSSWCNGEVLCFNVEKKNIKLFDSDTVSILSNLSKMPYDFNTKGTVGMSKEDFNERDNIRELVHKIRNEKSYFDNVIDSSDLRRSFFVTSKLDNPRIIRQSGAFIICGMSDSKLSPSPDIFNFERNTIKRLIIRRSIKNEIRKSLDRFNISSGSLFPDLSEVSQYIKSKYRL